nr:craniofacial development protein 2-like [Tanacetum cinerariifolium]
RFWDALEEMVRECPTNQRLIIGDDLNGHIGAAADGYAEVHGVFGFGDRNEEGCTVLEFATAHGLVGRIEAVDRDDHLRSCPSDLERIVKGRRNRSFGRLAGSCRIRLGSWNVG